MRVPVLALLLLTGCSALTTSSGRASLDAYALTAPDRLTVSGIHGACDRIEQAEVVEDDRTVRVVVPLRVELGGCDDIGLPLTAEVRLDAPLGDREVVDGGTGRPLDRRCDVGLPFGPYSGKTVTEVEASLPAGITEVRVVCRDGRELDRTSDRRPERLDVTVEDGRVQTARD